jgi:hypothetical protein
MEVWNTRPLEYEAENWTIDWAVLWRIKGKNFRRQRNKNEKKEENRREKGKAMKQ